MIRVKAAPMFGWYYVSGEVPEKYGKYLLSVPGVRKDGKQWVMAYDMLTVMRQYMKRRGVLMEAPTEEETSACFDSRLYEYQVAAAQRCVVSKRRFLNFEMGLGKTPTAIEALQALGPKHVLIVCPAVVQQVWEEHVQEWWENPPDIHITSFGKLHRVPKSAWDAVIVDEAHYFKKSTSKRSKAIQKILKGTNAKARLFLTGTPIDNEPEDLWNQVNLLIPGAFGTFHDFRQRYCDSEPSAYAYSRRRYFGINAAFAPELKARFAAISERVTKQEVAHLLPPITVSPVRIKPERVDLRELLDKFARAEVHMNGASSALLRAQSSQKIEKAVELAKEAQASGATHIAVVTHMRQTAKDLGDALGAHVITGETPVEQRHEILREMSSEPAGILCATMHSITTGLSLTSFTEVIYAELDWRPSEVAQSMARYHRVSGKQPVHVQLLILEGTLEEQVAAAVLGKLANQNLVYAGGVVDGGIKTALEEEQSDEDFLADLRDIAADMAEEDVYL